MAERRSLLSFIPNALNIPLLVIILVLMLTALGFIVGGIQAITSGEAVMGLYTFIAAAIYILPAIGIWKLKRWARKLQIFLSIFNVAIGILQIYGSIASGDGAHLAEGMVNVVLHGLIALYLLSESCRRVFGLIPPPAQ